MPVELVIAPEAELDIAEAYVWYEDRKAGLGEEFLTSVDACLDVHEGYRRSLIRRFPNAVFYEPSGGDGHDLRRISYLWRPVQMAPAPSLTNCVGTTTAERPCGTRG